MLKKLSAILCSAIIAVSMVACGSSGSNQDGNTVSKGDANADDTLTVWCWDPTFNIAAMKEAANQAGVKVDIVETSSDDCEAKLITAATSGQYDSLADIILLQDNSYQKFLEAYPDAFVALDDIDIDWSQFSELKQNYSVKDGKHYGVPFDNGAAIGAYRTDILKEAGYTVDDFTDISWDKFIEMGEQVYKKTGKYMLSGMANSPDTIMMMLQSCGASLFDEEGNAFIEGNQSLETVLDLYTEMVKKNVYLEVNSWDDYVGSISKENVAAVMTGNWITASIMQNEDQSGKWAITNLPILEGVEGATHYSNVGGSSWYISSNCKNVALAEKLLASTFGSSVEFYETILPTTGAISTYLPTANSKVYQEKQAFWSDEPIFSKIVEYSSKVPSIATSPSYYEGRETIGTAVQNIIGGADKATALKDAQAELEFRMQE